MKEGRLEVGGRAIVVGGDWAAEANIGKIVDVVGFDGGQWEAPWEVKGEGLIGLDMWTGMPANTDRLWCPEKHLKALPKVGEDEKEEEYAKV